jgi:hypothetical protein
LSRPCGLPGCDVPIANEVREHTQADCRWGLESSAVSRADNPACDNPGCEAGTERFRAVDAERSASRNI